MACDDDLARRVRALLTGDPPRRRETSDEPAAVGAGHVEQRAMFGGLAFLVDGAMAVCVAPSGGLMVRVRAAEVAALRDLEHVHPVLMNGREVRTWVRVEDAGLTSEAGLRRWVTRGLSAVRDLPAP